MKPPPPDYGLRLTRAWTHVLRSASLLVLLWTSLESVRCQSRGPRFRLPDVPYDYVELRMPHGLPGLPLHRRSITGDAERANDLATLGRVLFYDKQLSANRSRSCASCHQQERGFADSSRRSRGFRGRRTHRNSMSIANLRFHRGRLFWDGRSRQLEEMVMMPITDEIEMGLSISRLVRRLRADRDYDPLWVAAFGSAEVSRERIAKALAAFVRAIVSLQSKFDRGYAAAGDVAKDFDNFTPAENRGKAMFYGVNGNVRHSCAACHVERIPSPCGNTFLINAGMFSSYSLSNNGLDSINSRVDRGLGAVSGRSGDEGMFRAPSLRNIEVTGPYMHDGRFATLAEVVRFYAHGVRLHENLGEAMRPKAIGDAGWSRHPASASGSVLTGRHVSPIAGPPGFPMGSREQRDLVAFLLTLTDHALLTDPRLSDPFVR